MRDAASSGRGASVALAGLEKRYDKVGAVNGVSLDIESGEFLTLLGPSGSGKTTTLMMIAGFETPSAGDIAIDGTSVVAMPPHRRNIGMVFQNYALFPHMSVFDNVAFPLRMRDRLSRDGIVSRVGDTLSLVGLTGLEHRYPRQLSGGQQQRVSMARALVSRPRLLLMDEPLGALDKKLREHLQSEIKQIHQRIGSTFICVTHDQTEALTMSDLVVVMHDSRVVQVGSPRSVYEAPVNAFVADFLGGANLLPSYIVGVEGDVFHARLPNGEVVEVPRLDNSLATGSPATIFIRPEDIQLGPPGDTGGSRITTSATVREILYMGDAFKVTATVGEYPVLVRASRAATDRVDIGAKVSLAWLRERSRPLPPA